MNPASLIRTAAALALVAACSDAPGGSPVDATPWPDAAPAVDGPSGPGDGSADAAAPDLGRPRGDADSTDGAFLVDRGVADAIGPAADATGTDAAPPPTDTPRADALVPPADAAPPPPPPSTPPPRYLSRLFGRLDSGWNAGEGLSAQNNERAGLAWGESYVMQAYVAMFDTTRDPRWLEHLAEHIERVLANRDDTRGVADYAGRSRPCWRNTHYQDDGSPYCYAVHTGQIVLPMVLFADRVRANAALADTPTSFGATLGELADRYLAEAARSAHAHDDEWRDGPGGDEGYYIFPGDAPAGVPEGNLPANQQNVLGSVWAILGALEADAAATKRAARLARLFRRGLGTRGEAYVWDYWNRPPTDRAFDGPGEDISHAAINVQFAAYAAARGVVFTDEDLARFVHTFTDLVARGEADVADRVDGTGDSGDYDLQVGRWLVLTPWDRLGSVFFTAQGRLDEALGYENGSATNLLNVASLAAAEPPLRLSAVTLVPGPASAWAGLAIDGPGRLVAARNFDGNVYEYTVAPDADTLAGRVAIQDPGARWAGLTALGETVVGARNRDGAFVIFARDAAGALVVQGTDAGEAAGSTWAGVSSGVFTAGGAPSLVAARNAPDGALLVRELNGATTARRAFGADAAWAGITACDLDGDGLSEIAAVRNRDAHVLLLRPDGAGGLATIDELDAFGPASRWASITCGDFDGDGRRELAAVRDFDGGLYLWNLGDDGALHGVRHVLMGASQHNAPLTAGRLYPDWPADALAGASNRTGHVFVWTRTP